MENTAALSGVTINSDQYVTVIENAGHVHLIQLTMPLTNAV